MFNIAIGPNTIVLTPLRDHPQMETPPFYCFRFRGGDNDVERTCVVEDASTHPRSYQRFMLEGMETHTSGLGHVQLMPFGMWQFSLWGCSGATVADIIGDAPLAVGLCTSTR